MKYLLLLIVLVIAFGIWRSRRGASSAHPAPPPAAALAQDILACAHCGIHIPRSEALVLGDHAYCCPEHRRLGPG